MKTFTILSILTIFFLNQNFISNPDPLSKGLIAHYSFNNCDAKDDSGNESHGKVFGNPGCRCGVDEDALWLDGIRDYIEFQGKVNNYFTTSDFTISFYFKPSKYNVFKQSLLSKRDTCNEYHMFDIQLDINNRIVDADVHETEFKDYSDISPEMDSTVWQHFALVREGIRAYTYINGQPRRRGLRCSGIDLSNNALLSFANSPCVTGGRSVRFSGAVDELRIYDRALTADEMLSLYSRAPVETAELDCFTYLPKKSPDDSHKDSETDYLCANF
jgi:hypothetical protein